MERKRSNNDDKRAKRPGPIESGKLSYAAAQAMQQRRVNEPGVQRALAEARAALARRRGKASEKGAIRGHTGADSRTNA